MENPVRSDGPEEVKSAEEIEELAEKVKNVVNKAREEKRDIGVNFGNKMPFGYRPIDRSLKYTNVGADKPSWTADFIHQQEHHFSAIADYCTDEDIKRDAQVVLRQIQSDRDFFWSHFKIEKGRYVRIYTE